MPACNDIAFGLLCELIEAPHTDIQPDTVRCSGRGEAYERLLELQALQVGTGLAGSVLCPWCGDDELCSLSFSEEGYRGYCGDCGWLNLASHQVKPLRVEYQRIVRWIASALGLQGRFQIEERVPARLWRLGEIEHRRKRCTIFFGRQMYELSLAQAIDGAIRALAAPGSEIVITTTPQESIMPSLLHRRIVPLRAIAHLRKAGFVVENLKSYLDAPLIADEDVAETSLRLLRSGRLALIDGKQIKVSPQIYRFLSILIDADGKPVHKRVLADALEMDVDACKGSEIFKRHKTIYQTFVDHDTEGRYWLKPEFLSRRGGE